MATEINCGLSVVTISGQVRPIGVRDAIDETQTKEKEKVVVVSRLVRWILLALFHTTSLSTTMALVRLLGHPPILARLLPHLDWPAVHAVLNSSSTARYLFDEPILRTLILARFVPGIPRTSLISSVPVDIEHLHLFRASALLVCPLPLTSISNIATVPATSLSHPGSALS